jgi:hypothetical protein
VPGVVFCCRDAVRLDVTSKLEDAHTDGPPDDEKVLAVTRTRGVPGVSTPLWDDDGGVDTAVSGESSSGARRGATFLDCCLYVGSPRLKSPLNLDFHPPRTGGGEAMPTLRGDPVDDEPLSGSRGASLRCRDCRGFAGAGVCRRVARGLMLPARSSVARGSYSFVTR